MTDDGDYLELFRLNPVIGRMNPVARVSTRAAYRRPGLNGTEVIARTTLGLLYEGPMGMVHGGIIASLFDQFLSIANIDNGFGAFTGTLTIRYRNPCPLDVPICVPLPDRSRRRPEGVRRGRADHRGGAVAAEAEGIFIQPSVERLAEIIEDRERVEGEAGE